MVRFLAVCSFFKHLLGKASYLIIFNGFDQEASDPILQLSSAGKATTPLQLEGFFLVPKSIPQDPRINCMRTIRTQPPSGARIAPPRVGAVREANHHCNLVNDPDAVRASLAKPVHVWKPSYEAQAPYLAVGSSYLRPAAAVSRPVRGTRRLPIYTPPLACLPASPRTTNC